MAVLIEKLEKQVYNKRPILKKILSDFGGLTLSEYAKHYYRPPQYSVDSMRKTEFISTFKEEVESIFGPQIAESCSNQVSKSYHLANTEHHGPIGTSRQLNNILIASLPFLQGNLDEFPNNIILGCSNISFNNWSFPRGFKFHANSNKGLSENIISFFGHAIDALPVYNYKAFTQDSLKNLHKSVYTLWNERYIWKPEYKKINTLIDEIFSDKSVTSESLYTNQSAKINYLLWKKISETFHKPLQNLIFVEQERLANRLLLKHHISKKTAIYDLLFNPKNLDLITKYFDGILCGFSEKDQYGTFLFWALPKKGKYRTQLWRRGQKLVSPNNEYEIELSPECIKEGIIKGELVPSTLLCFILFSFYYGLRQIGGPNQTTYLTQMKEAYVNLENELGNSESAKWVQNIPTTDIVPGNPPVLAFVKTQNKELIPATPLDLFLYGDAASFDIFQKASNEITLKDSIMRTLPIWYKRCYSESEYEKDLLAINEHMIDAYIGLDQKMNAFATIGR